MSRLDWQRDGADWPNHEASRFVRAAGHEWHVQQMGDGPAMLLLHGTGAATHSWGGLMPLLAPRFAVTAIDLPGHGFTSPRPSGILSLPYIARAIGELLSELKIEPQFVVGHSAGAAIALRMVLDGRIAPRRVIAINGALLPFPGFAQHLFPALAKLLFLNPVVPRLMAWRAQAEPGAVERLIGSTGSKIDDAQMSRYARLFSSHEHADAALGMMANWDLDTLERDLPKLAVPVTLIEAENDRFIPAGSAEKAAGLIPAADLTRVPELGHLAHEEDPQAIANIILAAVGASGSATARAGRPGAKPRGASDTGA